MARGLDRVDHVAEVVPVEERHAEFLFASHTSEYVVSERVETQLARDSGETVVNIRACVWDAA